MEPKAVPAFNRELLLTIALGVVFSAPVAPWARGTAERLRLCASGRLALPAAVALENGAALAHCLILVYSLFLTFILPALY